MAGASQQHEAELLLPHSLGASAAVSVSVSAMLMGTWWSLVVQTWNSPVMPYVHHLCTLFSQLYVTD